MYFDIFNNFKEIKDNQNLKFFMDLYKNGWDFDFSHNEMTLDKKDWQYKLQIHPDYLGGVSLEVWKDGKAICGGNIEDINLYGRTSLNAAMKKGLAIAKKAIKENEEYFIKTCFTWI